MSGIQWFAFVILPLSIACLGYGAVRLFEFVHRNDINPIKRSDKGATLSTSR
jgi:hypothetical protein